MRECIDGILSQTFSDFELIIVNDASTDANVERVVKSYTDTRIRYYVNERNLGISETRNKLIELAQGEYLAVHDHDDVSLPERFAKEGTKNIVLERTEHINKEQILINQARKLDWRSVSANMNYLPVGHEFSPILLGVTDSVAAFFKDGQMRFDSRDVNRISDGAVRHFCRAFFARYSSGKYNPQIEGLSAVYAKRTALFCKTAFLSLRQRLFMKRSDGLFRIYTIFGFSFKVRRRKI